MWYVYIVRCRDDSLYCGITTNMKRRLEEHNGERPGGARYTRSRRPVRLVICVEQPDRSAASCLENRVQSLPRSRKIGFLRAMKEKLSAGCSD